MTEQSTISLRDAFGQILMRLAEEEARLVVLDADLSQSTRTSAYRQKYPSRYLNVGIAEQNMVSVAAGIALAGGYRSSAPSPRSSPGGRPTRLLSPSPSRSLTSSSSVSMRA